MDTTIAAVATGNNAAGIGVIRISGKSAIEIAAKVFCPASGSRLEQMKGYSAAYGHVTYRQEQFDNAVALVFRAPRSYTGEDVVEISVHGGIFIVERTLEAVLEAGAEPALPGEFTKRAFLNGKMDLTQAESVAALISADGAVSAKASFHALQGSLSNKINEILQRLVDCSAQMAAWVDYPDEEIPELQQDTLEAVLSDCLEELKKLLDGYDNGQIMKQGIDAVIAGRPNVGKSTLMNLLSGREKSIVTEMEGTTRDIVEETVRLGSFVLHLSDTAGLRRSKDRIEAIGIKRAEEKVETAALIIAVFDGSMPLNADDMLLIERCRGKKAVAVINKADLECKTNKALVAASFEQTVSICAKAQEGRKILEQALGELLGVSEFDSSAPLLANQRQKLCCRRAFHDVNEALLAVQAGITYDAVNVMIDSAVNELLSLTGKKATEEVVNNIFSKFCVGK